MQIETYSFTLQNMSEEANCSIDLFLDHLVQEGIISDEQRKKAMEYRIIHRKSSLFGRMWNKFFKQELDVTQRNVVKVLSIKEGMKDDDK